MTVQALAHFAIIEGELALIIVVLLLIFIFGAGKPKK